MSFDVVIPTAGRRSLEPLVATLVESRPRPARIIVVDDRADRRSPLPIATNDVEVVAGRAAGPAAARNLGWWAASAAWIAFLDDDVVVEASWTGALTDDLAGAAPDVAGTQGRIVVPLPAHRRPTDWERNVAGLQDARWATADMAYRRVALERLGGFDERFPRAYREDADLALRALRAGWRLERGRRSISHPVRAADWRVSLRLQAGNADDVLMSALHGAGWRAEADAPRGRFPRHLLGTALLAATGAAAGARRPRLAAALGAGWLAATADFAWKRIAPGPRTPNEVARMVATSTLIPPLAVWHRLRGMAARRSVLREDPRAARPAPHAGPPDSPGGPAAAPDLPHAVLFDRDGTLVIDVPYNGDPEKVTPVPGAHAALERLRAAGIALGVVTNQSGVARGLITERQVAAVHERLDDLLGPLGPIVSCPHGPDDGCSCRKPAPGLIVRAARDLGVDVARCVVVGDIGADVEAARAAGARGILVPTPATRDDEVASAETVAPDLAAAVDAILGEGRA